MSLVKRLFDGGLGRVFELVEGKGVEERVADLVDAADGKEKEDGAGDVGGGLEGDGTDLVEAGAPG